MIQFFRRRKRFTSIGTLAIISILVATGMALIDTIWAVYLYDIVQSDIIVGAVSTLITIVGLGSYILFIPLIERYKKKALYAIALFITAIGYALFAISNSIIPVLILALITTIITSLRTDTFGIILKQCSTQKSLVKNEGIIYTLLNLGWIIGPLLTLLLLLKFHIPMIFLTTAFLFFLALLFFLLFLPRYKERKKKTLHRDLINNIRDFFRNPLLVKTYIISGTPSLWWAFIFIYIPVHMIELGRSATDIAVFLLITLLPVTLFSYYYAAIAEKLRYTPLFFFGNLFLALALLACFFIDALSAQLLILIIGSLGVSMVEAPTEAYFFLVAPKKTLEKYYGVYNTSMDTFSGISKLLVLIILIFLPFHWSFLALAAVLLSMSGIALTMPRKQTKSA